MFYYRVTVYTGKLADHCNYLSPCLVLSGGLLQTVYRAIAEIILMVLGHYNPWYQLLGNVKGRHK